MLVRPGIFLSETMMAAAMEIAANGPPLVQADKILMKTMREYWGGSRWHLVKRKRLESGSKAQEREVKSFFYLPVVFSCNKKITIYV